MRNIFFAGLALAVIFAIVSLAIELLNVPNDWSAAACYLLLLALVSALSSAVVRVWRRL